MLSSGIHVDNGVCWDGVTAGQTWHIRSSVAGLTSVAQCKHTPHTEEYITVCTYVEGGWVMSSCPLNFCTLSKTTVFIIDYTVHSFFW